MHIGVIWFLEQTLRQIIFALLNAYFRKFTYSATITWSTANTLLRPLGISNRLSVCSVLKMVLILKRSSMYRICFLREILLTCGMTVPWFSLSEGWLLLSGFIIKSMKLCGYSLSITSCFIFSISLLKSFDPDIWPRPFDQATNDSSFHLIWVIRF